MTLAKTSIALALAGAVTLAAATPTLARDGRSWGAAGAGFVAGAVVGATVANSRASYGYGPGYSAYGYAPGSAYGAYAYAPGSGYDAYAYAPGSDAYASAPGYTGSGRFGSYDAGYRSCAVDGNYNKTDYGAC